MKIVYDKKEGDDRMFDEFYLEVYREIFFRWIIVNAKQYQKDQITCYVTVQNDKTKTICFETHKVKGTMTIWFNNIVEEEIIRPSDQKLLFYLHFTIMNLSQCCHLFNEFYQTIVKHTQQKELKIALCCTGGLSTSVFIEEMQQVCELENIHFQLVSLSLNQLYQNYQEYDALYLAPQIAHMEPEILALTKHQIPLYCIDATLFATKNYRGIIQVIQKNIEFTHKQ